MQTRFTKSKCIIPALFLSLAGLAQTPRLSLLEEFTGETCAPCAIAHPTLDAYLAAPTTTPKVVAIKWMVPIPAAPSPTWSLYKTNKVEIDWRYGPSPNKYGYSTQQTPTNAISNGINVAPTVRIDGQHQWAFGAPSDHNFATQAPVIDSAQSIPSSFSIIMAKAWDQNMTTLNATVSIVASQNFNASGALIFRTVMIEKNVQFATAPGASGETSFYSPVIASFPDLQLGTSLPSNWVTNQSYSFTVNCPLPSYTRDVNQVDLVGFIQDDGNKQVEQAVRASDCQLQSISATSTQSIICAGETVTLSANGAGTYSWSTGQSGNSIAVSPTLNSSYSVISNDANSCSNT